jgi:hypothetical protein
MTPINSSLKAALWMMGAVGSFTAMAVAARQINHVHDSFEIMLARSGIGFVIVLVVGAAMGQLGSISTARLGKTCGSGRLALSRWRRSLPWSSLLRSGSYCCLRSSLARK